jgi:hypothetical protein
MDSLPHERPTLPVHPAVVRTHVARLKAVTPEDQQALLTELLVAIYPTSAIQDS